MKLTNLKNDSSNVRLNLVRAPENENIFCGKG